MNKFEQKSSSQEQKESQDFSSIEFSLDALTSAEISAAEQEQKKELNESRNNILNFFERTKESGRNFSEFEQSEMEKAFIGPKNADEWEEYGGAFIATYSDRDRSDFAVIKNQFKSEKELDAEIIEKKSEIRHKKATEMGSLAFKSLIPGAVNREMRGINSKEAA